MSKGVTVNAFLHTGLFVLALILGAPDWLLTAQGVLTSGMWVLVYFSGELQDE